MSRCRKKIHYTKEGAIIAVKKHRLVNQEIYFCRKCMAWHHRDRKPEPPQREAREP